MARNFYIDQLYLGTNRLSAGNNTLAENGVTNNNLDANSNTIGGYPYVIQLTNKTNLDKIIGQKFNISIKTDYIIERTFTTFNHVTSIYEINSNVVIPGYESIYLYSNIAGVNGSKILPSDLTINDIANRVIEVPYLLPDARYFAGSSTNSTITFKSANIVIDMATPNSIFGGSASFGTVVNSVITSNIVNSNTTDYAIWRRETTSTYPNLTFSTNDWERVGDNINSAEASRLNASAAGDPHITTVNGEYYKFDYLGAFRLYEDNDLIINGLSEMGDATRWDDKQYIRKVFIQYHDKSILIDTGFRGTPAKILENNGFEYTDEELEFNQLAEVNCWECRKTYNILEKGFINRHQNKYGHKILDPIRNKITIKLDNFKFEIFNVNEYNLQPCRFNFSKLDNDYSKSKGCLIERKYVGVSILEDIKDTDKMVEIDVNNNNDLVELYSTVEMNVELIDPKFI